MKKEILIFIYRVIDTGIALFLADYFARRFFNNGFWWQLGLLFAIVVAFSPIRINVIKKIETKFNNGNSKDDDLEE